jgi:hypothetical protein
MLRHAAKRSAAVRGVEDDLLELSDLRNAIVHERGGGYVIAEPHPETVERLEQIVELLVEPPAPRSRWYAAGICWIPRRLAGRPAVFRLTP